jgi:hypothetical protein
MKSDRKLIFVRDFPRILTVIFLALLIWLGYKSPDQISRYSNLILVGITAIYAYLTYEILRSTRNNKISPYVNIEYIIASDFKSDFFKNYESSIEKSEEYLVIKSDSESENPTDRNVVFVKAENTGDSVAINIELEIKYTRKNFFDEHKGLDKKIPFQDLKKGEVAIKIFEVFEHPSANDYLQISKSQIKFKDIALYNSGEKPIRNDLSAHTGHLRDDGAIIVFKSFS